MEKNNLFEFYVNRECEGYEVLKTSPHAVVMLPHAKTQFKSRMKLIPYKQLLLPTSAKALANTAYDVCKGLLKSTCSSYVGGSEKAVYCKRYPIAVIGDDNKSVFSCYLEVGVMFSVSTPMFDRKVSPELADELRNMRKSNTPLKDRNQFIRDNCHDDWKPLCDDGIVSDGKIVILVESVIVTLSEDPAVPASWTFINNRIDQEGQLLTLSENMFVKQILEKLLKDKDTILALRSDEAKKFATKHGLSLYKKGSHTGKYKRNTDPNYNVVPKSNSKKPR